MTGTSLTHYRITAKLGEGGMGEVYRASDTKLGREVAIKVLPKDFADDPDRLRRFEQEAKTLAALNHPNILTIHDAGVHEGAPFLVSELLEGQTLREVLNSTDGSGLPVRKAMEFALQIVHGLSAAHGKGVIHRDLKPENIFVMRDGRAKILDFGLAKLKTTSLDQRPTERLRGTEPTVAFDDSAVTQAASNEFTQPGRVMGTPNYMAPEQVRGAAVDHRADFFAFGCVLYEMVSGQRPFKRSTSFDTMAAIVNDDPLELATLKSGVPPTLARIVRRCLEKQPEHRFQTAVDLAFALESVTESGSAPAAGLAGAERTEPSAPGRFGPGTVITLTAIVVVLLIVWHDRLPEKSPSTAALERHTEVATPNAPSAAPLEAPKTLAVLPFANTSADKSDDSFSDGMTEDLITSLQKVKGLRVQGRMSSFYFKGKNETPQRVGEQLKVEHLLNGSVSREGSRLRISADLVTAASGFSLWSTNYDRQLSDTFAIRTEVAQQVAQALKIELGMEETRSLAQKPTANPEAHRLYLLGRHHFGKVTEAGLTNAMQCFTQALQQDPSYALAYCGLADCYGWMGGALLSGREAWAREKELAQKALTLDPNLADAHLSLGIALADAFDWRGGEREIRRALELNPRLALAYDQLGWIQCSTGRPEEALRTRQKAIELDPLSLMFNAGFSWALVWTHRFDEAIMHLRKTLELDPTFADAHLQLGWCFIYKGDTAGAIAAFQKARALHPSAYHEGSLAYAYAHAGDRSSAERMLGGWEDQAKQRYVSPGVRMLLHFALGEKDKALDWLEKCYEAQDGFLSCWDIKVAPFFDPVRTEPRFQALLKKVFPEP